MLKEIRPVNNASITFNRNQNRPICKDWIPEKRFNFQNQFSQILKKIPMV